MFAETWLALQALQYKIVPAALRPLFRFNPADDQSLGRARHRDIEQPPVFVSCFRARVETRVVHRPDIFLLASRPNERCCASLRRQRKQRRRMMAFRPGRGVGEKDDRRFEPLGPVHRHDAHFVARHLHIALDLGFGCPQPITNPCSDGISLRS